MVHDHMRHSRPFTFRNGKNGKLASSIGDDYGHNQRSPLASRPTLAVHSSRGSPQSHATVNGQGMADHITSSIGT